MQCSDQDLTRHSLPPYTFAPLTAAKCGWSSFLLSYFVDRTDVVFFTVIAIFDVLWGC